MQVTVNIKNISHDIIQNKVSFKNSQYSHLKERASWYLGGWNFFSFGVILSGGRETDGRSFIFSGICNDAPWLISSLLIREGGLSLPLLSSPDCLASDGEEVIVFSELMLVFSSQLLTSVLQGVKLRENFVRELKRDGVFPGPNCCSSLPSLGKSFLPPTADVDGAVKSSEDERLLRPMLTLSSSFWAPCLSVEEFFCLEPKRLLNLPLLGFSEALFYK